MYIHRAIEENLKKALKQFPACLITGPRQAGKSTLLQHLLKSYRYVTFDDPINRELARTDPELFLSRYPAPLIIDELQYVPEILSYIKLKIDQDRRNYGQFVLTGSQIFQLMKGVSETLAGRIAIFHLYPLNWKEIEKIPGRGQSALNEMECAKQIISGFYPELLVNPNLDSNLWHGSYLTTYIERDVRNIQNVTDLSRFQTFISLLAARAGQLLNMNDIGKECGITQPTVKSWLSILESTYIIQLLKPFHNNLSKRLVKSPKLYFVDTGLLCYLLGIDTPERLFRSSERGHIFENMVVMECIKQLKASSEHSQTFFYRSASGLEVDLIVERQGGMEAYEIKFAKTLSLDFADSLETFWKDHTIRKARVLSLHEKNIPLRENVEAIHWSHILD